MRSTGSIPSMASPAASTRFVIKHKAIFYEQCPVLQSSGAIRDSRLALCSITKRALAAGLTMLGIVALERM